MLADIDAVWAVQLVASLNVGLVTISDAGQLTARYGR